MVSLNLSSVNQNDPDLKSLVYQLLNAYNKLTKELLFVLNNLDTRNINEIHAEKLVALSIETEKLAAGSVTAEKITVNELSAIAADLGHITAGLIESVKIISSYFGTKDGEFPLCEIDSATNRIRSANSEIDYISMEPSIDGSPGLFLTTQLNDTGVTSDSDVLYFTTTRDMRIKSIIGSIIFQTPMGSCEFESFYSIYDQSAGENLQSKLDALSTRIAALETP